MITGLNHITLAVSDLESSLQFYTAVLGMKAHVKWERGAYLSIDGLWLCLSKDEVMKKSDYTHIAFSVEKYRFTQCCAALRDYGVIEWKENSSEGDSMYFLDPDGHKLELHIGDLESRLESLKSKPYKGLQWL